MVGIRQYEPWNLLNELTSLLEGNLSSTKSHEKNPNHSSNYWVPSVDIKEEPEQYALLVDLPGIEPEKVTINIENNVLTINGKRQSQSENGNQDYYRIERVSGEFYRRFTLPENADTENVKAKSKHGVFEIIIPKKKVAHSRKIQIQCE